MNPDERTRLRWQQEEARDLYAAGWENGYRAALADVRAERARVDSPGRLAWLVDALFRQMEHRTR